MCGGVCGGVAADESNVRLADGPAKSGFTNSTSPQSVIWAIKGNNTTCTKTQFVGSHHDKRYFSRAQKTQKYSAQCQLIWESESSVFFSSHKIYR